MSEISFEDRVAMTQAIINILDTWGMSDGDQLELLGLSETTPKRAVRKFRDQTPLPEEDGVMERVEHVAGIAEALRTTYPRNAQMGAHWMQESNRRFDNRSPVQTILEDGLGGLIAVRAHLDCAFAWQASEAHSR